MDAESSLEFVRCPIMLHRKAIQGQDKRDTLRRDREEEAASWRIDETMVHAFSLLLFSFCARFIGMIVFHVA